VKVEFGADNTQTKVSSSDPLPVTVANASAGTVGVNLGKVDGTIQVNIGKVDDNVSVKFASVSGTAGVNLGKVDGTIQTNVGKIDDVVSVRFNAIGGTAGVNLGKVDGTIQVNVGKVDDLVAIKTTSASGTLGVHLLSTGGTVAVKLDPSYNVVNTSSTILLPVTVSGSTSGISASGVQLVAPESGHNTKVFFYSIQTTAIGSSVFTLTNGAGTSPTEFLRPLVTAVETTSTPKGANLAVTPPGYLFATGANVTLALLNPNGVLVHYTIGYFKESA